MNYYAAIDKQAAGPFDVAQLTVLFVNGAIIASTQIRAEDEASPQWQPLDAIFPSITFLPTRQAEIEEVAALRKELRSIKPDQKAYPSTSSVTVRDFDMTFFSMVGFIVKVTFAAIPAAIIIGIIWLFAIGLLGSLVSK